MRIQKAALATALMLALFLIVAVSAAASPAREFVGSFGSLLEPSGIAVDQETGNVYVVEAATDTIDVFGASGGAPTGVPSQITGLHVDRSGSEMVGVAVDNSCYEHEPELVGRACEEYDPSSGDVYVTAGAGGGNQHFLGIGIQKFKLRGGQYELASEFLCTADNYIEANKCQGVAVDSRGNLYITSGFANGDLFEFRKIVEEVVVGGKEEFQEKLERITIPQSLVEPNGPAEEGKKNGGSGPENIAVYDPGIVYISPGYDNHAGESESTIYKNNVGRLRLDAAGVVEAEEVFMGPFPRGHESCWQPVALDPVTHAVFVGVGHEVAEFDSAGELQLKFGSTEALGGSLGKGFLGVRSIAVNDTTGQVYVVNPLHDEVDIFGAASGSPVIEAQQPPASGVTRTSALIAGVANPESGQATAYFEYISEAEYEPAAANPYREGDRTATVALPGGHSPQGVERVTLTGLKPGTTYHYRLVVRNATDATDGPDETFTTTPATPPGVSTGPASAVTSTSVMLTGTVAPLGLSTSYVFEVGTSTSYTGARLFGNAGDVLGEVPVAVSLQYLVPGMTYHYRLVATSFDGTTYGQDQTFTTPAIPVGISQPGATALIASPTVEFPSVAGAITKQSGKQVRKARSHKRTVRSRACKSGKQVGQCKAGARKSRKRAAKKNGKKG